MRKGRPLKNPDRLDLSLAYAWINLTAGGFQEDDKRVWNSCLVSVVTWLNASSPDYHFKLGDYILIDPIIISDSLGSGGVMKMDCEDGEDLWSWALSMDDDIVWHPTPAGAVSGLREHIRSLPSSREVQSMSPEVVDPITAAWSRWGREHENLTPAWKEAVRGLRAAGEGPPGVTLKDLFK